MLKIDLSGKLAFATASSKGIGFGTARILAKAGAD
ncbi:Short-chain alcohol dehydrogenase, N-terminus [Thermococcus onnurineus NA1]|uniref:Short-chain alcohol dehydrogenase, N-terminus n=1 Tax=Thermococcus onnurineus (strain NA1) TaxID=523850 RepID=B6YWE7_THEON|nr:Short-chain alcohol dehydrogenase, N-terminus [Thermococcus onnurineus NA1]